MAAQIVCIAGRANHELPLSTDWVEKLVRSAAGGNI
jgi:hypothetical protein